MSLFGRNLAERQFHLNPLPTTIPTNQVVVDPRGDEYAPYYGLRNYSEKSKLWFCEEEECHDDADNHTSDSTNHRQWESANFVP